MNFKKIKRNKKAFVILFSVLVSTVILLITSGIFIISFKETILSSYANESQKAFYNADSIMECALFLDTDVYRGNQVEYPTNYDCFGNNLTIGTDDNGRRWFSQYFSDNGGCAFVLRSKNMDSQAAIKRTEITAAGYNVCNEDGIPDTNNPILLERRLHVKYGS